MEGTEVRKLAALEDAHWWYRERRHLLSRMISGVTPGTALDMGPVRAAILCTSPRKAGR